MNIVYNGRGASRLELKNKVEKIFEHTSSALRNVTVHSTKIDNIIISVKRIANRVVSWTF